VPPSQSTGEFANEPGGDTCVDNGAITALVLVLGYHQISADPGQLEHALGGGRAPDADQLVRMARRLGARARRKHIVPGRLAEAPLPAIAIGRNGEFFVIAAAREGQVLVQIGSDPPATIAIETLLGNWTGDVIFITTRAETTAARRFDVTWFIPALVKYRELLGEVVLASFTLQLFALATPLIFQVVIDKVLVHHGMATLDVLAVGLAAVIVLDALLSGLRAYLFTHTTNRIDVELGAKLYRHLLALPLAYFEHRRVGDSVARVRELETIREFLTSSSVTLVIDLMFTAIFLVIMWFYSPWLLLCVVGDYHWSPWPRPSMRPDGSGDALRKRASKAHTRSRGRGSALGY